MNAPVKLSIGATKKHQVSPTSKKTNPENILGRRLLTDEISAMFHKRAEVLKNRDTRYIRAITIGQKGGGKTFAAIKTLPRPILFLCFDPDAERIVRPEEVSNGEILPIQYYGDNPQKPVAYAQYEEDVENWKENGFFDAFASVVVDSLSTLYMLHLRQIAFESQKIQKEMNRLDSKVRVRKTLMPELQDYNILKSNSILGFMSLCSIPCHLVLTAHIQEERYFSDKEKVLVKIRQIVNAPPAVQAGVPPLFSEVWLSQWTKDKNTGKKVYTWLTERTRNYKELPLVTRMNHEGKILVKEEEPQDFRALLKKVNYLWEDKPFIGKVQENEPTA